MSDLAPDWLKRVALIVGILSGCGALTAISFFVSLPARVEAQEARIKTIEDARAADRELLIRIEERLISVQRDLQKY